MFNFLLVNVQLCNQVLASLVVDLTQNQQLANTISRNISATAKTFDRTVITIHS